MKKPKLEGKEAVFSYYFQLVNNRMYEVGKNTPRGMVNIKMIDIKLSSVSRILKSMGWTDECRRWGVFNHKVEKLDKQNDKFRERFGTKENPKEPFNYKETHEFRNLTLAFYHEAIENQGISHDEFMQRFKNEFSDVLDKWREQELHGKAK